VRDLLVTLIVFGSLPFIIRRPAIGILMWSWIGYMNPHRLSWGFAYSMPFAQIVAIATLIALPFSKDKLRMPWNALTVLWLLFVVWICITTALAIDPSLSKLSLEKALKIQLFAWLTVMLMQNEQRVRWLVWVIVLSLGFYGLKGGVWAYVTGAENRVWGPPGSFIEDNNALAMALLMVAPLMIFLVMRTADKRIKAGLIVLLVFTGLAILSSHSRGALLGMAAMLSFLLLKSRRKLATGFAIVLVVPVLLSFMPQSWFQRMETISNYQADYSALGRITAWEFAADLASKRITGGGFDCFVEANYRRFAPDISAEVDKRDGRFQDAHSIYFKVVGEQGFPGLILYLAIAFLSYRSGTWVRKRASKVPNMLWAGDLATMLQVSLIGFFVAGAFLGLPYFDLYFHLVALLVILKAMVQRELAAATQPATAAMPAGAGPSAAIETPAPTRSGSLIRQPRTR